MEVRFGERFSLKSVESTPIDYRSRASLAGLSTFRSHQVLDGWHISSSIRSTASLEHSFSTTRYGNCSSVMGTSLRTSDCQLECLITQRSSQWDGFRHFAYQKERLFYNSTAPEEILSVDPERLGIHRWSQAGGIAGRGILIDYASWGECSGHELDMSANPRIIFDDLQAALKMQQQNSADRSIFGRET